MTQFNPPQVGSVVTITTRYREDYIYADSEWRENVYKDVQVLPPEKWFGPNQIKITGNERMPFRVIDMKNVSDLKEGDRNVAPSESGGKNGLVSVKGSKGEVYTVTVKEGEAISCTCPHHTYRRAVCKHMKLVAGILENAD